MANEEVEAKIKLLPRRTAWPFLVLFLFAAATLVGMVGFVLMAGGPLGTVERLFFAGGVCMVVSVFEMWRHRYTAPSMEFIRATPAGTVEQIASVLGCSLISAAFFLPSTVFDSAKSEGQYARLMFGTITALHAFVGVMFFFHRRRSASAKPE